MKALSIIALIFAALSIFIPVGGVFIAMFCSFLVLISFYKSPTLSGVTFGVNIISTAFLSPSLLVTAASMHSDGQDGVGLYWFHVGFHIALFVLAIIISMIFKKKASKKETVSVG
ncbi:hypothetical protein M5U04_12205 [Xenorhabdus sp. XENO-1]|uniref:hypothetical protein n=1 Tax=Xenorhabdus bovienii TaxID=40576 RepID=UPI0020CA7223|nr:hypothetical protein [Xenorhabdus bovienii]MCP9268831.1 hypothetical protein [Xenorhabdus bovienii subsp. africana]